jgi:Tol biopolymer transport system component
MAAAAAASAASFPPELRFRSISTARVTVHFHQGLEPMAREAAALATGILERHEARYRRHVGRVQVVLADVADDPNGFATPLPYPLVSVRAAAPDGSDEFGNYEGWLRLVLTHELAHVVHLDEARGLLGACRKLLGRAPFLFPNALTPTWMIEGLATFEETQGTAFGRGRNPDSRMVLRMAALEREFLKEDQAVLGLDRWPAGQAAYLFGEAFLRDLSLQNGMDTLPRLARVHAGRIIPYVDDLTASRVTGASFHAHWREWMLQSTAGFHREAEARRARGLTESRALTSRGVRQGGPRFSPDGSWVAYTSRSLTRYTAIRLVRRDGGGDRRLALRNGGNGLSWTPDGASLVFDEPEVHRFFATRSDLRVVDVATGRVRKVTRGLRAYDPDVAPDGKAVVFVRRLPDRSELFAIGLDGDGLRQITRSTPGTEWNDPRWRPQGDLIVASRWTSGGWLDLVQVDPATGEIAKLTDDRAKDVEPTWTPDGEAVVFRSDRDGVSNLYALRLADRSLLQLTNVLGGAFAPSVDPAGRSVTFSDYTSRGYDVRVASLDLDAAPAADAFVDTYPLPAPLPPPTQAKSHPYRPLSLLWPRFWTPYFLSRDYETQWGAITGGTDALFRHAWGLDVRYGTGTDRFGVKGFYQYDRFRPTFLFTVEDETSLSRTGPDRTRTLNVRASLPLRSSYRSSQALSLTWRRERDDVGGPKPQSLDLGGLEAAWSMSTVKQYPYSISPLDGWRVRLAFLKEAPGLGSDVSLGKLTADLRVYARMFGERDVLALRAGGGATVGSPGFVRSFAVGGFPDANLFDLVRTNVAVLRGYPDNAFTGRRFAVANAEYRFPLATPQRGVRSLPFFIRHVSGSVFADAAHAWNEGFELRDVKTSAGAALGLDWYLGHRVPLTTTVGVARGFADGGETRFYFRAGLAF